MSTVPGRIRLGMQSQLQRMSGTLGTSGALQAPNVSLSEQATLSPRASIPRRTLIAAAIFSLLLGVALYEGLVSRHAATVPVQRAATLHARSGARAVAATHRKGLSSLPLAAQGPVSEAIGAETPAYHVGQPIDGVRSAQSPAQQLRLHFSSEGVALSSGATRLGLSLKDIGYGSALTPVSKATPSVKANRVTYARAGLSEFYVNGPAGLEQGFTIQRAPAEAQSGALTLSMALSGNTHAKLAANGQSITLSHGGGPTLRYSGLSATDANGHALRSSLALQGGQLLLRVSAQGARYPLHIDPFVQQGEKLTAKSGEEKGEGSFGFSVALSPEGNTALIGAAENNKKVGAAWVFTRSGTTWTQQGAVLTPKSGEESGEGEFGFSVSLSAEGTTTYALIGAPGNSTNSGAAWVFTRSGTTWTQQGAKLTGSGESGEGEFGSGVGISAAEGNYAVIGGPGDNSKVGAAWVFTRSGTTWTQQGSKLTGSGASSGGAGGTFFGFSVAVSPEATTALIGGPDDATFAGAAWVFTRSGTTWTQQGSKLTAKSGEEIGTGEFGFSVALAPKEGNTALIGAPGSSTSVGGAWAFTRSGTTWTQQGGRILPNSGEEGGEGEFGNSVALSAEGSTTTAFITAPGNVEASTENVGAAWAFARKGTTWAQVGTKLTGSGEKGEGFFGMSAALSSEGTTALIGGPGDNTKTGASWVFVFVNPPAPTVETKPATAITQTTATLNATVNPNGGEVTECKFEYGTTTSYGSTVPCAVAPGGGTSAVSVSAAATGLSPSTGYDFRIVATNMGGTGTGANATFTTLATVGSAPTVVTGSAGAVGSGSASLNATVNPNGENVTECRFEYGTTTSYGSSAPCTTPPGSGSSAVAVSVPVTGLSANTAYHFRISASSSGGTSKGSDAEFTTLSTAHWFANNVKTEAGEPLPIISWGTLTLRTTTGGSGQVTCHIAEGGGILNPVGGGSGQGETNVYAGFDCEQSGVCPAGDTGELVPQSLPWPASLGASGSVVTEKNEKVRLNRACLSGGKEVSGTTFTGSFAPTSRRGTSALHPGFFEFAAGSSTLEAEGSLGTVQAKIEGEVKVLGFEEQELIATKTP